MLPLILAGASMLGSAVGQNAANASTVEGAQQQRDINQQAIDKRRWIQDDLTRRNDIYYQNGVKQIPGIEAMSQNPDFAASDPAYGDKYSLGAKEMLLSSLGRQGRQLVPRSEIDSNFNNSEQGRLLNRRLDSLKIGYGQAGTAGQSLMTTGTSIADIGQRIGNIQSQAKSLSSLGRQQMTGDAVGGASYAPLYLNYKRLNNRNVQGNSNYEYDV